VAKVVMSHGLNANTVHGWRKLADERDVSVIVLAPSPATSFAKPVADVPQFVPVSLTPSPSVSGPPLAPTDIQIELRRGATAMKINWSIAAAADCAVARVRHLRQASD
jgi:transposase